MKRICVFFKITALAMLAILFLNGCSRQTINSSGNEASAPATSTASGGVISREQAVEITKDVMERAGKIYAWVLKYPSSLEADSSQTIPGYPDYWLVTDERFPTMAALKNYVETAHMPDYIEKHFAYIFDEKIYTQNEYAGFREYNGRLYANCRLGGRGSSLDHDWDTLKIISQDNDTLTVEFNMVRKNDKDLFEPYGVQTYVMKKSGNTWRLDDESEQSLE